MEALLNEICEQLKELNKNIKSLSNENTISEKIVKVHNRKYYNPERCVE